MGHLKPLAAAHPLVPTRRQGVVADITNANNATPPNAFTIGVVIGGDPTATSVQCAYLDSYWPTVGDVVYLLENQGDFIVIGAVGQSPTKATISRSTGLSVASGTTSLVVPYDTTNLLQNCSASTNGITVGAGGRFLVTLYGDWTANATARRVGWPFVNGSQYGAEGDTKWPNGATIGRVHYHFQVDCSAGDLLAVWVFQDSGSTLTFSGATLLVTRLCS